MTKRKPGSTRARPGEPMQWLRDHASYEGDACLKWPFGKSIQGYGVIHVNTGLRLASTAMCELAHGKGPEGYWAAHSCGKGHDSCVNPRHLRWATPTENANDRWRHGTMLYGELCPTSKLTQAQVERIVRDKRPSSEIAAQYGCSPSAIDDVRNGKSWSWLTGRRLARKPHVPGTAHYNARLTKEEAVSIYSDQRKMSEIAASFGVTLQCVSQIKNGKNWSHVTGHKTGVAA